ncbi:MAG TPA: Ni/Fe-hydrogenase cytochrome b subunit [Terriglobales bacterium]|nr:Ni/Fe-hydrogenase cytochrome b subunit [Terriglobales bacterium]
MERVRKLKLVLWLGVGLALSAAAARFLFGLGATTNLGDANAWGLWVGFDVMGGVALAAGGFIVTATVYIFHLEKFHDIVRPAVLTAFLGYAAVAFSLLFDLGLPWNIWHMMVYWNPHSPLFEVGWCVMLYLTVLLLEFLPVPAEEFPRLAKVRAVLVRLRLPLVLLGIGLSTLHQSSLGSLFLIMPYRVYPLWYSPILPLLFLVSAIALGIMMVTFESQTTAYLYHRKPETEILAPFAGAARWVLILYLVLRFGDLIVRGQAHWLLVPNIYTFLFWFEICVLAIVPLVLLFIPRVRNSTDGQWALAAVGVFGVVFNRIDTGGLAHLRPSGEFYVPSWMEISISLGIVSAAVLLFLWIMEHFHIWEQRPIDPAADPLRAPEFDKVGTTWLGIPSVSSRTVYSLAVVIAAAVGIGFITAQRAQRYGLEPDHVHRARGGDILWIDGNLDGLGVSFNHAKHEEREGGKASCVLCHHMNLPHDQASACASCHYDMYQTVDAFRHDWHASPTGANIACYTCHARGQVRTASNVVGCDHCHQGMVPAKATIQIKNYNAVSYTDAFHRMCIGCHTKKAAEKHKPEMTRCAWCHKEDPAMLQARDLELRRRLGSGSPVLPPLTN